MTADVNGLLAIIAAHCRRNWLVKGEGATDRTGIERAAREAGMDLGGIPRGLDALTRSGLIAVAGNTIRCEVPFSAVSQTMGAALDEVSLRTALAAKFEGNMDALVAFLDYTELIDCDDRECLPVAARDSDLRDQILDELLTAIERQDAMQIRYGLYDSRLRGADVLREATVPNDPFLVKAEFGLRELMDQRYLLPMKRGDDIRAWEFRSRIAETVRLLERLRRRFPEESLNQSPRLTAGVKLEVADRRYPRRTIPIGQPADEILEQLRLDGSLDESMARKTLDWFVTALEESGYKALNDYQYRSFLKIFSDLAGRSERPQGLILTAGTGMGKTLAYLAPLLLYILASPGRRGTTAINIYPRIKLAENQIESFVRVLDRLNRQIENRTISIGIDYSGTPYDRSVFANRPDSSDLRNGRAILKENGVPRGWEYEELRDAYSCPYARCPRCNGKLYLPRTADFSSPTPPPLECQDILCREKNGRVFVEYIRYSKEDIADSPPDILICTTESLNTRLATARYQHIFGSEESCVPRMVMIDEVHLHTSLTGSQVAWLIRRLIGRIDLARRQHDPGTGAPLVLGLSATIGQPIVFFHELTGVEQQRIVNEYPREEELEKSGAEYYVFVKPDRGEKAAVISTLIQTCMCVLHTMPRNLTVRGGEGGAIRYKALGFVDSLDLVQRWRRDLTNAERDLHLFRLRDPDFIDQQPGRHDRCTGCAEVVDETCQHFRDGECWWFMRHGVPGVTGGAEEPLTVAYKTAETGSVPDRYDLLVTTSAMEVGFDDPEIMCVLQYQSPMNIASFTQRKGRAGRGVWNRPITLAVLSPYKTRDIYYYRNHFALMEPGFEKPPMNPENQKIRVIHGFYAALDYLAYNYRHGEQLGGALEFPSSLISDQIRLIEGRDRPGLDTYLVSLFGQLDERNEREPIDALLDKYCAAIRKQTSRYPTSAAKALTDDLPGTLFSSINLPSVDITKDRERTTSWSNQRELLKSGVEINLALTASAVGNVEYRWAREPYWIPPLAGGQPGNGALDRIELGGDRTWVVKPEHLDQHLTRVPLKWVPASLHGLVPHLGADRDLVVIRPDEVRLAYFSGGRNAVSRWIYCPETRQVYRGTEGEAYQRDHAGGASGHRHDTVTDRSQSYPISFYQVDFNRDGLRESERASHLQPAELASDFARGYQFGPFHRMVTGIYFANNDSSEEIRVTKAIIGTRSNLIGRSSRIDRIYTHSWHDQDAGLGFRMTTDGMNVVLPRALLDEVPDLAREDPRLYRDLLTAIFRFEVFLENQHREDRNSFALEAFLETYLSIRARRQLAFPDLADYCANPALVPGALESVQDVLDQHTVYNEPTKEAVLELWRDLSFLQGVHALEVRILKEEDVDLIDRRLRDIFIHSFKHALKSATLILGGFENERDLGGMTYLSYDFDALRQIYIFEHGIGGTGAFRSIYHRFRSHPELFWNFVDTYLGSCPTGDDEEFLRELLSLPTHYLEEVDRRVGTIGTLRTAEDRADAIRALVDWFWMEFGLVATEDLVRLVVRLFGQAMDLEGERLENWRLALDLNVTLSTALRRQYGREPSTQELQMACFTIARGDNENTVVPSWRKLMNLLKRDHEAAAEAHIAGFAQDLDSPDLRACLAALGDDAAVLEDLFDRTEADQYQWVERVLNPGREPAAPDRDEPDDQRVARVVRLLFASTEDVPHYPFYLHLFRSSDPIPVELRDQLARAYTKRTFFEEVEKRLLNTCVDGCPSCLHTPCDIDGDPKRNRLLLSRRLLKAVTVRAREPMTISLESRDEDALYDQIAAGMEQWYQVYVRYGSDESDVMARVLARLLATPFWINSKRYGVLVNSSGYSSMALGSARLQYEVCLRCREFTL